jgi:hypothetical protein
MMTFAAVAMRRNTPEHLVLEKQTNHQNMKKTAHFHSSVITEKAIPS